MSNEQVVVARLPDGLVRRMVRFLETSGQGYENMSEFIAMAIANQLSLSESQDPQSTDLGVLGLRSDPPKQLMKAPASSDQELFILTNRFAPTKVGLRVLLNMTKSDAWPAIADFHTQASSAARTVGTRLRVSDEAARRTGFNRRWIGFPLGGDADASLNRYINCFTITMASANEPAGPMATLRLANIIDGRVGLTEDGYAAALAPSPVLGECDDSG